MIVAVNETEYSLLFLFIFACFFCSPFNVIKNDGAWMTSAWHALCLFGFLPDQPLLFEHLRNISFFIVCIRTLPIFPVWNNGTSIIEFLFQIWKNFRVWIKIIFNFSFGWDLGQLFEIISIKLIFHLHQLHTFN